MKVKYIYIALLLLITVPLHARKQGQQAIDSLLSELNGSYRDKADTNKVKLLIRLAWTYSDIKSPECLSYAQSALDLSGKLNFARGKVLSYTAMGDAYADRADNARALEYYDMSLKAAQEAGSKSDVAVALGNSAMVYFQMGDFKRALDNNFKALKICEETGQRSNIANNLNGIGNIYTEQGHYPEALEYHLKALAIYEQLGMKIHIANSHLNIANIFLDEGSYLKAMEHYNTALKINEGLGNNAGIAGCYISIGNVYLHENNLSAALEYFQKALKMPNELSNRTQMAVLANFTGDVYYKQKNYAKAVQYYQASLKICSETGDRKNIAFGFVSLGNCFVAILKDGAAFDRAAMTADPEIRQFVPAVNIPSGRAAMLHAATDFFEKSLATGQEIKADGIIQAAYEGLSEVSKLKGDYKLALEYAGKASVLKDSIFSKENNEKILRMVMKNDYESRRLADSLAHVQDMQLSNFRLQKEKLALFISVAVFVLITGASFIYLRTKSARTRAEQQASFSRQLLEVELKALRAQMNPHFIFNCLNSIQAFILRENKTEATEYLQKFSRLIRLILDNSQKTSHTIEDEVEILTLYLDMEKLRLKNKFDFEIKVPGNLDITFTEIPSMVLQPLVENSIWHGLMNASHKGLLTIEFTKDQNKLTCIVADNGIGRNHAAKLKGQSARSHTSKGIKLIEDRLQVWSRAKGLQYSLKVFDNDGQMTGTRTEITILDPSYA